MLASHRRVLSGAPRKAMPEIKGRKCTPRGYASGLVQRPPRTTAGTTAVDAIAALGSAAPVSQDRGGFLGPATMLSLMADASKGAFVSLDKMSATTPPEVATKIDGQ